MPIWSSRRYALLFTKVTNQLTSWHTLLEQLMVTHLTKKFPKTEASTCKRTPSCIRQPKKHRNCKQGTKINFRATMLTTVQETKKNSWKEKLVSDFHLSLQFQYLLWQCVHHGQKAILQNRNLIFLFTSTLFILFLFFLFFSIFQIFFSWWLGQTSAK